MRKELRALFVAVLLAAPIVALPYSVAARPKDEKPQRGEPKNRQTLYKEVRHQLVMLPWYSVFDNLAYQVEGDKVILYGQVTRPTLKSDAEAAVTRWRVRWTTKRTKISPICEPAKCRTFFR